MILIIKDYTGVVCKNEFCINSDLDYSKFCEFLADYIDSADEVVVYEKNIE